MKKLSEEQAIKLLKKHSSSEDAFKSILNHSKSVRKLAVDIGGKVKDVDLDFIKSASLLHDIGRFKSRKDAIKHGIIGADILREEGLKDHALVAERHLGGGISREDIEEQGLELPAMDYLPISKEEKIICHADNLIKGDKEISIDEAVERFRKELGEKVGQKVKKLAKDVERLKK